VNEVATHRVRRALIRRAVGRAAAVVVVSRALRERLISLGIPAQKVRLLYNGVDTKRFRPLDRQWARRTLGIPEDHRLLLFVGNLKEAKGPGIFVEALGHLIRNGAAASGCLVGEGPYQAVVEEKIQTYRLGERIRLVGRVEHDEMPTWYAAADAVCLPSLMEGVPNVVLEALACGRPVVATEVGGISEVMDGTCGVLVPARDPVTVASGLAEVLQHSWDPATLAGRVAHLSWDANARDLARILAQAAGAAP
jgi:glycosyltransferase involved in cell wall biosynthesis